MSLLLDALKRAEQEKSARGNATPEGAPAPRPAPSGPVSLELQPLANATPANSPNAARGVDPHGAQTLFDAKSNGRAADARAKGPLLAAIGAIAVIVLAAGAYVWYSINALSPRTPVAGVPGAPPRPPAAPTPPPASGVAGTAAAAAPEAVAAPRPATAGAAPASAAVTVTEPAQSPTAQAAQRRTLDLLQQKRSAAPAAEPPVQMTSAPSTPTIPAEVATGYDALRRGDVAEARRAYTAALATDASNVDALLGLATIEGRAGRIASAAAHYRRALQLDPQNATAVAGLAALADWSRPDVVEAQLRADLSRAPQSAALHSALGTLYASQGRWAEAQSAYFEAHRLEPRSPDTSYNLAVSLDQLGQARLAREYYARALEASRSQASQFDPAAVSRRLAELR